MFFYLLVIFVLLLILLLLIEKKYQQAYTSVSCTHLDRVAIDQSIMALHMYAQVSYGVPICLSRKIVESKLFIHYPKPRALTKDWWFHPIYGQVGFKSWKNYFMPRRCMMAFMGINHQKKLITLAFRNSRMFVDWLHNVDISFVSHKAFNYQGPLHRGYTTIFTSLVKKIDELLDGIIRQVPNVASYTILLTGHSLGGSLATLAAVYLVNHKRYGAFFGRKNIKLVTFGAPYVGVKCKGHDFTSWMQQHIGYIKCFERSTDMAPFLPKFVKMQAQKKPWKKKNKYHVIEPVPPGQPIMLFHYHASRLNFRSSHYIVKYRKAIYKALNLPCQPIYQHLL